MYKEVVYVKKVVVQKNDVMINAYGSNFIFEHMCRLLKNLPKWLVQHNQNTSKRIKTSTSGKYLS